MTVYYVDFVNGADANNGLGPDASAGTNKPWKTIAKLLGAAGMASGDTAYLSPAGPFREVVTVAMTSAVAETKILGDPGNQQGFKTSGGVRVAPGPVEWTAFTTNDKTAPSGTTLLNLSGRDFLTFERIHFVGGSNSTSSILVATTTTSVSITFRWCSFIAQHNRPIIAATNTFPVAFTWLIEHCWFGPTSATTALSFTAADGAGADYDVGVNIRDNNFVACGSGETALLNVSGSSTHHPGGLLMRNNTMLHSRALRTDTGSSSSIPCLLDNNVIYSMDNSAASAGSASTISATKNIIYAGTAFTGTVTQSGNVTDASYAPKWNWGGQDAIHYPPEPRPWGEPLKDSPWLVFGDDGSAAATDLVGLPRPVTALAAVGAFGTRHNTFTRDPSPIGGGGVFALRLVGPGDFGFRIPVEDGVSYDISIDVQWDATYAGTKPSFRIDANPRAGVAAETITATGSSGSPETLTLSTITPVVPGGGQDFVIVRVVSSDSNGGGLVQTDDLVVA